MSCTCQFQIFTLIASLNWPLFLLLFSDTLFPVYIPKGPRGLGLSVSGGSDSNAQYPGLIRIKRLFPHQAAWSTGVLQPGDIILSVNGLHLTGLTNYVSFVGYNRMYTYPN